jgi:ABC-2 type transport system ATP-binding protein
VTEPTSVPALSEAFEADPKRGISQLAVAVSEHANDRTLVARAVMLQREMWRVEGDPTREQVEKGRELLRGFAADQESAAASGHPTRRAIVDAARARSLGVEVSNAVVVECSGVEGAYRRSDFRLRNVTFELRYGEIAGIVGRNANGKTTLFRLLVGELMPTAGQLRFPALQPNETPLRWSRLRQRIAYVPQVLSPWHGSLRSNLHYEAAIHGVHGADNFQAVDYIVERLGLRNELDRRWPELSGGYQLRFALARALVWKPSLLILDEPLANLDPFGQQIVLNDLRQLADSIRHPLAVLVSSQHLHEIEEVSDKLLLLAGGVMKFFGAVEDLGRERRVNRFEMAGRRVELHDLEAIFADVGHHSLHYTGVAYVLTTPRSVTRDVVLDRLSASVLPITYFRDISHSAKSLLQDDGDA